MANSTWFLIAYDISDPGRSRRAHYYLRARAMPMQKSVFVANLSQSKLHRMADKLQRILHAYHDDLRIYRIDHPRSLWLYGVNPLTDLTPESETGGAAWLGRVKRLLGNKRNA